MTSSPDLIAKLGFREAELQREMNSHGKIISANKGDVLIREGQYLDFLPIVLKGSIRVYSQKDDREILLYYVHERETCVMSLSSAYFSNRSAAYGVAMEPTDILVIPTRFIAEWQLKFPSWNDYVIKTFRRRYDELLDAFGSIAFNPVQLRLKEYLHKRSRADGNRKIAISHQALAGELGTTRVVVSRLLKQFEQAGEVKLHRGFVQLV